MGSYICITNSNMRNIYFGKLLFRANQKKLSLSLVQ